MQEGGGADWKHRLASQSYLKAHLFWTFFFKKLQQEVFRKQNL